MKKMLWIMFTVMVIYSSCSKKESTTSELVIFAAASLTETITEIAKMYMTENPKIQVTVNLDSSGTLKKQIQQGAYCDLFLSASQKQMNALDISKGETLNPDNLDFIDAETRTNILENKVTLVISEGNPKNINNFDDLVSKLKESSILLGMGNSDVPVGQYASKVLKYFNLDEEAIAKAGAITYGSTVKEVTTQVRANSVDCGFVYCTDAYSANLTIVDFATFEMCGQVVYPAAVTKSSKKKEDAIKFLNFLKNNECKAVFERVGFTPIN